MIALVMIIACHPLKSLDGYTMEKPTVIHRKMYNLRKIPTMPPPNIKKIQISGNIPRIYQQSFEKWTQVEFLSLKSTGISCIDPHSFCHMRQLSRLEISYNYLPTLYQEMFCGLENLRELFLHQNFIVNIEPYSFKGLSQLIYLNLNHNQIAEIKHAVFYGLPKLMVLLLHGNPIKTFDCDASIQTFVALKLYTGFHCRLYTNISIKNDTYRVPTFYMNHSLHIQFKGHAIKELYSLAPICMWEKNPVDELNLNNNEIKIIPDKAFCLFDPIKEMYLNENKITHVHPSAFDGVTSLGTLSLRKNYILSYVYMPQATSKIMMDWNNISNFHVHVNHSMTHIYLQNNALGEMPSFRYRLVTLHKMYLEWNNVSF